MSDVGITPFMGPYVVRGINSTCILPKQGSGMETQNYHKLPQDKVRDKNGPKMKQGRNCLLKSVKYG